MTEEEKIVHRKKLKSLQNKKFRERRPDIVKKHNNEPEKKDRNLTQREENPEYMV